MLISQVRLPSGEVVVAARDDEDGVARTIKNTSSVYQLALEASGAKKGLVDTMIEKGFGGSVDIEAAYTEGRLLQPISHPDPAHLHLTGTGLTHLGSASARDAMHRTVKAGAEEILTDSMTMFRMGIEGGKPEPGRTGVQPEWFYKGNGAHVVAPGKPLVSPSFALDAGEEPELAGIYIIGASGIPFRIGFAVSNEFSDHVTERINYLYLAHSKLRQASFGPEIRIGTPPGDVRGFSRIVRDSKLLWEKPFVSGEANMSHTFANLEYHHFKYGLFRTPGDVHVHMFGTATLSFSDGVRTQEGDVFEIGADGFGLPLRNALAVGRTEDIRIHHL